MSPLRVADAAHIVPYPHTVGPHGQVTPIPLNNAGRNRMLKPAKKAGGGGQRSRDNEAHIRKQPVSRETRPAPTTQRDRDDDEISIPDYPPPSFLEAISSPPLSVCPSTTTLPRPSTPSPLSATRPTSPMPEPQPPLSPTDSVADSDGSLEIIDMATVPVSNEPIRRPSRWRSATAPTPPTSRPEAEGPRRALLDDETDLATLSNRAKHLSLSPFRLLSQKPASPSTPYRSTSFFKSTTSIATSHNASSLRLSSPRSESPLGRKLFTKGKERSHSRETLDSWEVLESEQAPPPSLLSAVEYMTSPPSSPTSPSPISPVPLNTDHIPSASTESLSPTTPRVRRPPPPPPPPRRSGARSPSRSPVSDPFVQTPEPGLSTPLAASSSPTYQRAPSPDISPTQPVLASQMSTMRSAKPYVHRLSTSPIPFQSPASPSTSATPTRHHYLGRPLPPRPPGPPPSQEPIPSRCPEGILIDLDDHTPVSQPVSRSPTEVTDLDLLISRLEYDDSGAQSGANYDDLLLISEILGPGPPPAVCSPPPARSIVSGLVSVERRRVMKDGRVKLKLVLMGTAVDRCGICLTQFKEGDCGAVGEKCRHSCHEKCIVRWLARSWTCPLCREAWS